MTPASDALRFDVAVVGGGVVGCAVARELAALDLSVALVEARSDVGDVTSKANTAILHTGFDAVPGSTESRLVARGHRLLSDYAQVVGIPVERTGAVLVAWTEEEEAALPGLLEKAQRNGYARCRLLTEGEVRERVPALALGSRGGLLVPDESIICPWTTTLAFATEAHARGVVLLMGQTVAGVTVDEEWTTLTTELVAGSQSERMSSSVHTRWVVNAAGLGADVLDRQFGYDRFTVVPRRGELLVFDKFASRLVDTIVLPVPSSRGKGVLISPTIYGNVMLGPTAEDLVDRDDTSTSASGIEYLLDKGRALMPELLDEDVTASYAGLRAATEHSDYVVHVDGDRRYLLLGGIRSTGLSASMAIAEEARTLLSAAGFTAAERTSLPSSPQMPMIGERFLRPYQDEKLIARDPAYGEIVCFCERVTAGEIRDALASPLAPKDLSGLRRRTRATMGRCQAFYCGARVAEMLERGSA